MRDRMERMRKFIIYFLLAVLVIGGSGTGLDITKQALPSCHNKQDKKITSQSLISTDQLAEFEIIERYSAASGFINSKCGRSRFSYRYNLYFLCVLVMILEILQFSKVSFVLYGTRYVPNRHYNITFMQDMDGRKKFHKAEFE